MGNGDDMYDEGRVVRNVREIECVRQVIAE